MMMIRVLALVLSLLVLPLLAAPADAHGLAGRRFFPSTLAIEDPFVSDELTLPNILHIKRPASGDEPATRETEVSGELSKRMMVSPGNITALVERLVESGHISRTTSPADRRVQIIALTPFGRAAFKTMADAHAGWIAELFGGLSAKGELALLDQLGELKRSIVAALGKNG